MNANKLKAKRIENGYTQNDIAVFLEKSVDAYAKKERGETGFSQKEISILTAKLHLKYSEFNEIFFDAELPNGKFTGDSGDDDG